jgi:hypothetical protein
MIRTILSVVLTGFVAAAALKADPSPNEKSSSAKKKETTKPAPKIVPAAPLASGWSYVNGVWTHVDGYRLVNGQVVRAGVQTHKKAPKPPTKAEMEMAMKKKQAPQTPAEAAAAKAAEKERNLRPTPPRQTGTHL